jgi:hypothetical protein
VTLIETVDPLLFDRNPVMRPKHAAAAAYQVVLRGVIVREQHMYAEV